MMDLRARIESCFARRKTEDDKFVYVYLPTGEEGVGGRGAGGGVSKAAPQPARDEQVRSLLSALSFLADFGRPRSALLSPGAAPFSWWDISRAEF